MKTLWRLFLLLLLAVMPFGTVFSALDYPLVEWETILTQKKWDVIWKEITDSDDPFRDGTEAVAEGIWDTSWSEKIFYEEITDSAEAWTELSRTWRWIVNWTLWVAWLFALIYLIYHGFLALTAGADEEKLKKWQSWIRFALIAVFWIAVAWFIISVIFWLIWLLVS